MGGRVRVSPDEYGFNRRVLPVHAMNVGKSTQSTQATLYLCNYWIKRKAELPSSKDLDTKSGFTGPVDFIIDDRNVHQLRLRSKSLRWQL